MERLRPVRRALYDRESDLRSHLWERVWRDVDGAVVTIARLASDVPYLERALAQVATAVARRSHR